MCCKISARTRRRVSCVSACTPASWRIAASAVISLVGVLALLGVVGAQFSNGNRATSKATQANMSSHGSAQMMGTVDLRNLAAMKAGQTASALGHASRDRMTAQQRAAYWAQAQRGVNIPKAPHVDPRLSSTPSTTDPKFLGGAILPPLVVLDFPLSAQLQTQRLPLIWRWRLT